MTVRVAVVCKFFSHGGVMAYNIRLAAALAATGAVVDFVLLRGELPQRTELPGNARVLTYAHGTKARLSQLMGLPILRLLLRGAFSDESSPDFLSWVAAPLTHRWSRSYDGIFISDEHLATFVAMGLRLNPVPYAVQIHEGDSTTRAPLERTRQKAVSGAKFVLTPSPALIDVIRERYGRTGSVLIITRPIEELEVAKEPYVLVDTRWSDARNASFLFDIMDCEATARYVLAGSFPSTEQSRGFLRMARQRGHHERLMLRLNLFDDELDELYNHATAYLRWPWLGGSGRYEHGLGWGVVRSLERGCPCIVDYRIGGAALIKNGVNGFIVDGRAQDFAQRVDQLLSDSNLVARISWNALETAKQFSFAASVPRVRELLSAFG